MADKIHLTEVAPPYCSSCFSQQPTKMHVDFGAYYDGPVIKDEEGVTQHVIDDLIICEMCLHTAGSKIGMGFVEKIKAELDHAEKTNDELMEQVRGLKAYIQNLEAVRDSRPSEILDPPKSKPKRTRQRAAA